MKLTLKISIILNLVLLGGLVFIRENQHREGATSALLAGTNAQPPAQAVAVSVPPIVQQAEQQPFRWSQLESTDYRTYIKNLRDIGCPEATLRAIVTADVHDLYQKRHQELEQKLADINNSPWPEQFKSFNSQQALKAELQKLPGEEASEIVGLQQEGAVDTTSSSQVSSGRNNSQNTPVLPLVFQNVDLHALNLSDQQIQAINNLRQSFMDAIGGPNQDPQDPAYLERWQKAQPETDSMMRSMLGVTVWEDYQVATWNF